MQWSTILLCFFSHVWSVASLSEQTHHDAKLRLGANSSNSSDSLDWKLHRLHGGFMCLAWLGIVPWAVFIARYLRFLYPKGWFQAHRAAMLTAVLFIASSLGIIAYAHRNEGFPVEPHTMCGIFSISLAFLQPLVAALRPHPTLPDGSPHPRRWIFNWFHRLIALTAATLALAATFIGTNMIRVYGFPNVLACPISFIILLAIFGFLAEAAHQGYIILPPQSEYQNLKNAASYGQSEPEGGESAAAYGKPERSRSSSTLLHMKAKQFWLGLLTVWVIICVAVSVAMFVCIWNTKNNGGG